ncbi:GH36-type glycosyl hydrolase domain-containing protein [Sandaracinobacter neustonicus]|uniref:GH36-type glycosyl hydrolase domain-containing protein n=1 Tax=Sandaracinobacter neustonicus TaxID=1715348 RepID=UPI001A9C4A95|nr:glucoamylase family protein [Sandaracinobacter neustonicus]
MWSDPAPIRSELFSDERLEVHGRSLAVAQQLLPRAIRSRQLLVRLQENAAALKHIYVETALAVERKRPIAPAAEWLIDNYHIVEKQIRKIRDDLPADFYLQLPKLADGPLAGLPRVFGVAWAYIAHSDSLFHEERLRRFVAAYQRVEALTIGELWALAICLQLVLVENLHRLADLSIHDQEDRQRADELADKLLSAEGDSDALALLAAIPPGASAAFISQLAFRLRDVDPRSEMARRWLDSRVAARGDSLAMLDQQAQQALIASTASTRNVIMAMRDLAEVDWGEMVEALSRADAVLRAGSNFGDMDFPSRNLYRNNLEELSRGSAYSEEVIAARALALARRQPSDNRVDQDPGVLLVGAGRPLLEADIGFVPPVGTRIARRLRQGGVPLYVGLVMLLGGLISLLPLSTLTNVEFPQWLGLILLGVSIILSLETATALMNRMLARLLPPALIPALELKEGVPDELRTLLVVPVLLGGEAAVAEAISDLEVHHLANREANVHYALLSDFPDAADQHLPGEEDILSGARARVAELNMRHPVPGGAPRFLFLHRERQWNATEGCWMGWERKRGKLHELNRLLRGANDTSYTGPNGQLPRLPPDVRFVITLDADTRLPMGTVKRMIGKMGHPLNRPRFDGARRRVVAGYGIMQPRVTIGLPVRRGRSRFETLAGGPAGIDPYAAAASDLYQDLIGEGSFTGKGIYEIDAFMASLAGRVPENRMLSHDLFEGTFARAGLISDVEVVEDFPVRYDAAMRRQHRWVRGDWQLLPWILSSPLSEAQELPWTGRVKMLDNLRRSLVAPAIFAALVAAWFLPWPSGILFTLAVLLVVAIPPFIPIPSLLLAPRGRNVSLRAHLGAVLTDIANAFGTLGLQFTTLADQAWRMVDAILRTLIRLFITKRHLLEWTTAAQASASPHPSVPQFVRFMWPSLALVAGFGALALWLQPQVLPLLLPFAILWLAAPAIASMISRPRAVATAPDLDRQQKDALEAIARQTWHFFRTHVTTEHNNLPPDNFQEDPQPVVAGRTSPTNMGLYLLCVATARNFGWCDLHEALARLEATLDTFDRMSRTRGHFYNWYDTRDLRVLDPPYVSAVDSGNLAGHLLALANLLEHWREPETRGRVRRIADRARGFAMAMDFRFLVDPERQLLSIGWSEHDNRRDEGCYDLLASEARLASLFCIAKGDLPAKHWGRLGRSATPIGPAAVLISWSGSMFEYLMPSLVMRAADGSLLEVSNRYAVRRQRDYAAEAGVPWGISESAYNARDREMTYQYTNFGVPGLGLKRGLSENLVIAPYASGLAAMVDAKAALANLSTLEGMGARGEFGFYEALDFTPARVPDGRSHVIVRTYMAHHQAMLLLAIANVLDGGRLRDAFHAEPMIRAAELLLHERPPRGVGTFTPRAEEVAVAATDRVADAGAMRSYGARPEAPVAVHLLSNGRYSVMLGADGAGSSRWNGMAINRWREDPVVAGYGHWIYLADRRTKALWSATQAPFGGAPEEYGALFAEGRAEFHRRDGMLTTTTEVLVSPEDDAEVRRVSIANSGRETHEVDVTSCVELALAPPATDLAHPAFARMFVETEVLDGSILIARRRPRGSDEAPIWAAHLAVLEGEAAGPLSWETDRSAFMGRGHSSENPLGATRALEGHAGTVLDPLFALRCPLKVPPGKTARVAFWTIAAPSREALLDAIDRHRDAAAFDRAHIGSWTQAQIERRFLGIDPGDAADFQRLAAHLISPGGRFAPPPALVAAASGPQSSLWVHGISGDLPILLLRIDDARDLGVVQGLLRAFEYLRGRQLAFDLVILNDRSASYIQDLQVAIDDAVRNVRNRPAPAGVRGDVFTLRADLMQPPQIDTLRALSRAEILAQRGPLRRQLRRTETPPPAAQEPMATPPRQPRPGRAADGALPRPDALDYWNGFGGFHAGGREYAMVLEAGSTTPAPWINVIANPEFGCHVSADSLGAIWSGNARENQLTPWSNDTVADPPGDALYIRDEDSGQFWTPTALPAGADGTRIVRHGFGTSRIHTAAHSIEADLLVHVPLDSPVRITRLTLRNMGAAQRTLSVTGYAEWVLGQARSKTAARLVTEHDGETGALFVRNPFDPETGSRIAFADMDGCQQHWTCDRAAFLGRGGSLSRPAALVSGKWPAPACGAGLDPCAALQAELTLAAGEAREIVWIIGQAADREGARALIRQWRDADLDAALADTHAWWQRTLGAVQVETPDRAFDLLLNGWLPYQILSGRIWGRAGFYQASGAYGFRDQLQDGGALLFSRPDLVRPHLLRAAGRQFREGDVQHWWLPESGRGVRTRISDDRGWLALSVADYVDTTGDTAILDTQIPFLEGRELAPGEHDAFYQPTTSTDTASLFEHCARALDQSCELLGDLGIPLIGGGDWNDGMNRVGEHGKGMSVWLGWHLIHAINRFAPHADAREPARAAHWRAKADSIRAAIETHAWDGEWYRRATYDDGTWLGTAQGEECRIDSIAQTWSLLSGAADPARAAQAMRSVDRHLVDRAAGIVKLFTPPFSKGPEDAGHDPGYIRSYPPGLRENGGQYSHAAMWTIMAAARAGDGAKAAELFRILNPVNHALTPEQASHYRVEPYVVAADVYSVPPHDGRGGWTWYTGAAGWMFRAGLEGLLGLTRRGDRLQLNPVLPPEWPEVKLRVQLEGADIDIQISRATGGTLPGAELNGTPLPLSGGAVEIPLAPGTHRLIVRR